MQKHETHTTGSMGHAAVDYEIQRLRDSRQALRSALIEAHARIAVLEQVIRSIAAQIDSIHVSGLRIVDTSND